MTVPISPPVGDIDNWVRRVVYPNLETVSVFSQSWTPSSVAANTSAEQTTTVTGVNSYDYVLSVNPPSSTAGVGLVGHRVSADNTVAVTFMNTTAGALSPPSGTYVFIVLRYKGN